MVKVLFVCLGNICRSPVAEGVFKEKVREKGLEGQIFCDSAGTSAYHIGESPDARSRANALENGITLQHAARQFTSEDLEDFHYVLAMDKSNLHNILELKDSLQQAGPAAIHLMRAFDPQPGNQEVPDPYFGGADGFQQVFDILDRSCERFLEEVIKEHALT